MSTNSLSDVTETIPADLDELPLAPIERFLLGNDSPDHPVVFRVLMQFDGKPQREKLSEAFRLAISRQPLLRSCVAGTGQSLVWRIAERMPELDWQPSGLSSQDVERLAIDPIDLQQTAGLRCRVWSDGEHVSVLLDIHHACCDGQGARQFIAEWLSIYDQLVKAEELRLTPLAFHQLHDRADYRKAQKPIGTWEGLRNLYLTVRGKTIYLPERNCSSNHSEGPVDWCLERSLTIEQTARVRKNLKSHNATINDAGLVASFSAFVECFPEVSRKGYITLLHPVDLRWPSDLRTPACNRVGVCFLRRKRAICRNPEKLLKSLRGEMRYIKQRYVGAEFLRGLSTAGQLPGGTTGIQNRGWFTPTFQFTCLGDTTRSLHYRIHQVDGLVTFGGLRVRKIAGFMQLGPFVPMSLAACETNQQLTLTARASVRYFDEESAGHFLDVFVEKLLEIGQGK